MKIFFYLWAVDVIKELLLVSTGEKRSSSNCGYLGWNRTICGRFDYQVRSWFWHKNIIGWRALSLLRSRSLSRHATLLPTNVGRSIAWRDKERLRRRLASTWFLFLLFVVCLYFSLLLSVHKAWWQQTSFIAYKTLGINLNILLCRIAFE